MFICNTLKGVLLYHFLGCIVSPIHVGILYTDKLISFAGVIVDIPEYVNICLMRSDYYDPI